MATSSAASQSVSQPSSVPSVLKRKSKDVGWNYGMLVDAKNMDKVQCIKCGKMMSGGIYRIKEHIAHISGNVAPCSKSSKEDQAICRNAIDEAKAKRKKKKVESEELRSQVNIHNDPNEEGILGDQLEESLGRLKPPRSLGPMDKFASAISPETSVASGKSKLRDQNINEALFKHRSESVREYVGDWVYEAGIPFNAIELDSFKLMVEAIGQFGPGFVPPTRYDLTVPILRKAVDKTKSLLKTHEEEWKINGCSIMTDAWSDRKRRSIMNLCVNSRLGTVFLSSNDLSNISHTSEVIFEYVDKCIEELGSENVVQVVTDNASNNIGASKLLKNKRPKIFWTSCAAHTMNLMLETIGKQTRFKKVIDQAKALSIFLYAHHSLGDDESAHEKEGHCEARGDTVCLVISYSTKFVGKKSELKMMFGSPEWEECKFSKAVKGKEAYTTVMSLGFWNGVSTCLQVFTPLIKVLRIADSDRKPSMGFLYGELIRAKEEIKVSQNNISSNYEPIIQVIDEKMKGRLDSPLHLTAYLLNPYYHYKDPLIQFQSDVSMGLLDFMDVLFPGDDDMQNKILLDELPIYKEKSSIFGRSNVASRCLTNDDNFDPVTWWSTFGSITPNLRSLAMRILSLTTSSSGCERNWSAFEGVHTKKRNRINATLLNNLVFIQFNARLLSKHKREKDRCDVDVLSSYEASTAQEWIVGGIEDDDEDVMEEGREGVDKFKRVKYRTIRELYDDDFESEDEVNEDVEGISEAQ